MGATGARVRWALVAALLVSLVAAASARASDPRAARRALRADVARVPTSVTGDSVVTDADADPPSGSSSIDPALVRRVAGDMGCVIVTWANDHYRDFARSWVGNLRALGLDNFMVGAMDADLYAFLTEEGVPTWLMGSRDIAAGTVERDFGWGTKTFHQMGRDKIRLIRDLTRVDGVDVLISDIDTAWLRDPVPFFRRYPTADMLVSTDQLKSETEVMPEQTKYLRNYLSNLEIASSFDDEGLELHICHAAMNIGVMWFRSTSGARLLTEEWVRLIEADDDLWDQNAFNDLVRLGGSCSAKPPSDGSGLFRGFEGKVVVGTLPASQFANGHAFHAQRMHSAKKKDPFAVHNTFQYGGTPGKRHRMREANVWRGEDVDSRFLLRSDGSDGTDDRVGFLSYDPRLPADVDLSVFRARSWPDAKDDTFPTIASKHDPIVDAHAKLVEFQLAQLRTAVAVASSLGRVVIAPPILCGLDRVWFPHFGRFPGSQFALPFICPLDHVLAVERSQKMDLLREHSFLSHPELPDTIRRSVATVDVSLVETEAFPKFPNDTRVCLSGPGTGKDADDHSEKCGWLGVSTDPSIAKRRVVLANVTDLTPTGFAAATAGVRSSKVLHLSSITPFMKGRVGHEGWEAAYAENADVVDPDVWCCAKDGHREFAVP
jgi:hypothetical protein